LTTFRALWTPCSRFAPDKIPTPRIVDLTEIDYVELARTLSCGNSMRATVIARVELRGFEPLTL
jgi:hypothetical protein